MSSHTINVLIVEDSSDDALLLVDELKAAGFDPNWKRVESKADYLAGLADSPDLIISDYTLPQFDGLRAMDLLRERGLDIPFILVSGTVGEEKAVEAMKHGVTDYLLKDRLERLGNAVERALEQKRLREERKRMEEQLALQAAALETAANAIIITDAKGTLRWVNPAFTRLTGYAPEEAIGQTPRLLKSGKHDQAFYRNFWKTILSGHTWSGEFINRRKDGSVYYDEHTVTPVRSGTGAITHFVGIMHDVTARKSAEDALQESERRFSEMMQRVELISMMLDREARITYCNDYLLQITGWQRDEVLGRNWFELFIPPESAGLKDVFAELLKDNPAAWHHENEILTRSGGRRLIRWNNSMLRSVTGEVIGTASIGEDVTESVLAKHRVAAFSSLGEKLNSAKTAPEAGEIIVTVADELFGWDACTLDLYSPENDRIHHVLSRDTINGERVTSPPAYDDAPPSPHVRRVIERGAQLVLRKEPYAMGDAVPFGDKARPSASLMFVPIRDGSKVIGVLSIQSYKPKAYGAPDLEALQSLADHCGGALNRIQAAEDLKESEERYRALIEQARDIVFTLAPDQSITSLNPAFDNITGWPRAEWIGRTFPPLIHAEDLPKALDIFQRIMRNEKPPQFELRLRTHSGGSVALEFVVTQQFHGGTISGVMGIGRDTTERKKAQSQMLRAQRLESIGTLAGGIAHDLNNALAPILMGTELVRMQYPEATEIIDTMEGSAKRAADMVRQLLTFAKGVEGARMLVQPQHLLKEMGRIIKATFPKNLELRTLCAPNLHTVLGDATQLHQVLLNLCVNARDAMPNGGTLTLEAENVEIDATYASTVPEALPGRYVVWRVTDTGTGIPPEVLERIFEPFFSTKGPDKGTGLGLSTVIGIVKSHGGFIRVYSQPGAGSTFAVYLPFSGDESGETPFMAKAETAFRGSAETILVVDDEANVRQVARSVLTALNFQVITASDGTEALIQVAEKRSELCAVITDLHMPFMDGLSFVRVLRHMLPEAGIIVATGWVNEAEANEFKSLGVGALLDKPFTQEQLVEALKTVLKK